MRCSLLHNTLLLAEQDTLFTALGELSSLTLSLNVSHEIQDAQWLTSELKMTGGRLLKILNQTSGLLQGAYLAQTKAAKEPSALLPAEGVYMVLLPIL